MTNLTILDNVFTEHIDHMGGDYSITQAARVSTNNETQENLMEEFERNKKRDEGLINYLMRKRHGSPFEQTALKFYVKAPIMVFREFHRHRIGFSYNEMSGRYTTLPAEFYIPSPDRKLVNMGTSANPKFTTGSPEQVALVAKTLLYTYETAWEGYSTLLDAGIANEVARLGLPVGIFSRMYVTCNTRSLMSFLSLRTEDERATFPSNPQWEIQLVARQLEVEFARLFPVTHERFVANGRVAP